MKTQRTTLLPAIVLVLLLAPLGFGQLGQAPQHRLGYYNPATGTFTPLHPAPDAETPAVTPTTGTSVFNYTITVKSVIPKNSVITCNSSASVFDASASGFSADEQVAGTAKLVSGTTWSCSLTIHYSWPLAAVAADKISLTSGASIDDGIQITATNGTGTTILPNVARLNAQTNGTIAVPASGATTTEVVAITL